MENGLLATRREPPGFGMERGVGPLFFCCAPGFGAPPGLGPAPGFGAPPGFGAAPGLGALPCFAAAPGFGAFEGFGAWAWALFWAPGFGAAALPGFGAGLAGFFSAVFLSEGLLSAGLFAPSLPPLAS